MTYNEIEGAGAAVRMSTQRWSSPSLLTLSEASLKIEVSAAAVLAVADVGVRVMEVAVARVAGSCRLL